MRFATFVMSMYMATMYEPPVRKVLQLREGVPHRDKSSRGTGRKKERPPSSGREEAGRVLKFGKAFSLETTTSPFGQCRSMSGWSRLFIQALKKAYRWLRFLARCSSFLRELAIRCCFRALVNQVASF
jgi:hypothetical protein